MKTAVSIPDPIFEAAEKLSQRLGLSRSALYARALQEFAETHREEALTEAMNEALEAAFGPDGGAGLDPELAEMQARTVEKHSSW